MQMIRCTPCDEKALIRGATDCRWGVPMCALCARKHDEEACMYAWGKKLTLGQRYMVPARLAEKES